MSEPTPHVLADELRPTALQPTPHPTKGERATVLVVDDVPENVALLGSILEKEHRVRIATDAVHALKIIESDTPPDLVLLDVMMPGMSGYEVCKQTKANPARRDIPIIFVTARGEIEDEERGFALGAVDYLAKPVVPVIVAARVRAHLELVAARRALARQNEALAVAVRERTQTLMEANDDLRDSYLQTIDLAFGLMSQADDWLGHHCRRVSAYVLRLANRLDLDPQATFDLRVAALLHDLALLGLPSSELRALFLRTDVTPEEHERYFRHPVAQLQGLTASAQFQRTARIIAVHHENLDGSGFPAGLAGDQIPLAGRILAVADRWDVFAQMEPIADRPHTVEEFTRKNAGQLDPQILSALAEELRQGDPFSRIVDRYTNELEPGMIVATPFRTPEGAVLLRSGTTLRADHIAAIKHLVDTGDLARPVQVYRRGMRQG